MTMAAGSERMLWDKSQEDTRSQKNEEPLDNASDVVSSDKVSRLICSTVPH